MQDKRIKPRRQRNGACPEGKIYSTESGGQDYGQHKVFEASRHRGRNVALTAFSPSPGGGELHLRKCPASLPSDRASRRKMRPANTASRMVNTAGKRPGIRVRMTRGIAVSVRGSSSRKRSDGRPKKLPGFSRSQKQTKRTKQARLHKSSQLAAHTMPFFQLQLKRRTCMFSISMSPQPSCVSLGDMSHLTRLDTAAIPFDTTTLPVHEYFRYTMYQPKVKNHPDRRRDVDFLL